MFDSVVYNISSNKTIIATMNNLGSFPGTLTNNEFISLDQYKYPGDYVISITSLIMP